jgi:prepilin-type N-terminal cleavage/methylation domain-containing protein
VFKSKKGFTLIELLVVIGILGILAIGLLAAIDPFEQLKKGRDTNLRNVTVEYVNATTRYYATHGVMPWPTGSEPSATPLSDTTFYAGDGTGYTEILIAEGELKPEFQDALGANADLILVTGNPDPLQAIVCFDPDSKSLSADATTRYSADGTDNSVAGGGVCPDVAEVCYWCAR